CVRGDSGYPPAYFDFW
nr:immunoglobulin heavy chain junction region [Macaca mulatta]MOV51473.1 immunoglobulin heavy chain junction region [Macaca mulatta]MOV51574.1 immunoglobulin heavy chain junction region [Macaca mulatta]MOV52267.1 immunoglobulin heavy chain junction region [Macaca mulatta]